MITKIYKLVKPSVLISTQQNRSRITSSINTMTKLYGMLASPSVRAVLLCAKALGIEFEFINIDLVKGDHVKDDFVKKNPQRTIPVIEEEDGFIVSDSHAIMAYLVTKYGKDDSLYPATDAKRRAIIDQRLHFDSSVLYNRGLFISRPLILQDVAPPKDKLDDLREAFNILEQILVLNKTEYVAGNSLSIPDFSIITTLTTWDLFLPYADFPHVKAYVERIQKLPVYEANIEGLIQFNDMFSSKLKEVKG